MGYSVGGALRCGIGGAGAAALAVREVTDEYGADPEAGEEVAPWQRDPDAAETLGDEIATLAAHIHAATHRMLVLIARFDRLRGWEAGGHRSCAYWLSYRTGYDLGTAREHVRVARALEVLPGTGEAMSRGRLSFSQVRALTRVADAENESELLELAEGCTTAQLERMVRAWKKGSRGDEAALERERHRSRTLSVFPDEEGMYVVRGRLDPEVGAVLMRAIEAASDALYKNRPRPGVDQDGRPRDTRREAKRRRADAIGLLAERALAAGFGADVPGGTRSGGEEGEAEPEINPQDGDEPVTTEIGDVPAGTESEWQGGDPGAADPKARSERGACNCGGERPEPGVSISGTRAERYQVVLHVEPETLSKDGEPGRSELEDGTRVSAETSRRLSCDAAVVRVAHAPDGSILDVGRRTRTIPPALRRALEARDRGCRFPGCGLRFTAAHHVHHWADGGKTSLGNTLLLCRHHHRLVHEGGWTVRWWGKGRPAFLDPRGQAHMEAKRRRPELPEEPVAALVDRDRRRGVDPGPWDAGARWQRARDIPDAVLFDATGAW